MDTIFIPSKGRYANCATHKNLEAFDIHNWMYVVEPQEYDLYVKHLTEDRIWRPETHVWAFNLETFKSPKSEEHPLGFEYLDDLGWKDGLTTGPGPARNAIQWLARKMGLKHYWMMDDDIANFCCDAFFFQKAAWTRDRKSAEVTSWRFNIKNYFELYERFLDKYDNVGLAEIEKQGLVQNHRKNRHFSFNCKTYSCIRFNTAIDIPWRSRYNDDVVISLDYEHRGYTNVSSKIITYMTPDSQYQAGGMTEAFHQEGTLRKVKYLLKVYPEVSYFALKFGRFHHLVDYSRYSQPLVLTSNGDDLDDLTMYDTWNRGFGPRSWPTEDPNTGEPILSWVNVDEQLNKEYGFEPWPSMLGKLRGRTRLHDENGNITRDIDLYSAGAAGANVDMSEFISTSAEESDEDRIPDDSEYNKTGLDDSIDGSSLGEEDEGKDKDLGPEEDVSLEGTLYDDPEF